MSPEIVQIGLVLLSIVCAALGWWARVIWSRMDGMDVKVGNVTRDLSAFREEVPQKYASHTRMEYVLDRIDAKLDKLFDRINEKADK